MSEQSRPGAALEMALREGQKLDHLRRLGVPKTLMSDFEFTAAVFRDSQFDPEAWQPEVMAGYDRRGLLNVIAWLVESPTAESREAEALLRRLLDSDPFHHANRDNEFLEALSDSADFLKGQPMTVESRSSLRRKAALQASSDTGSAGAADG